MQGVCQALQQELDRLQRQRWQQQVQCNRRTTSAIPKSTAGIGNRQPMGHQTQQQGSWNYGNSSSIGNNTTNVRLVQ